MFSQPLLLMNDHDIIMRFEELEAGRVLGDLSAEEANELLELSKDPRCQNDFSLELTATALEIEFLNQQEENLPDNLATLLRENTTHTDTVEPENLTDISSARVQNDSSNWIYSAKTAWAIAALLMGVIVMQSLLNSPKVETNTVTSLSPQEAQTELVQKAQDLTKLDFAGIESYSNMSGEVVWSDELQEGYMTFTNLAANDPKANQYQLWIVDPQRDEKPVDGGVFDIPAGQTTVVIPINNPLIVKNPQAFVITLEQPGGVVVSKQETVVALAKPS